MEVQLRTFLQLYWLVILQDVNLLDQRKKQWSRVGERFFRNAAKEMKKTASRRKKREKNSTFEVAEMKWH